MNIQSQNTAASTAPAKRSFAAMQHGGFRIQFITFVFAMMADNIEHVISYWTMFQKFHSPALAGFAGRMRFDGDEAIVWYLERED